MTAAVRLTREEIGRRLLQLDPSQLTPDVLAAARRLYRQDPNAPKPPAEEGPRRDPEQRRRYAGDPWAYIRDVLGFVLTPDQEAALALIEKSERVLLPSGNNLGKTHLLASYGIYRFDAVAALPDEDLGLEEQGAILLLPGPDEKTIHKTIYSAMLETALRAERRGFPMPGRRSELSVLWQVRPRWHMEHFAPAVRLGEEVKHTASGRHHRNMIALIEEGQGVSEAVWRGAEGMCSAAGNKIVSAFNPTEPRGPAFTRARGQGWDTLHLSALTHPNVRTRSYVIPAAIDYKVIDKRVANECRDMGSPKDREPDTRELEFLYALPPEGAAEAGARADGIPGHPDGTPRLYRPLHTFAAQVLGRWPRAGMARLFDEAALDDAMARWRARAVPRTVPDVIGVDPAREGRDTSCTAPRWGESAEALLRAFRDTERADPARRPEIVAAMREARRQYVGEMYILPKGDGVETSELLWRRWPLSTFVIDETGVGASVLDHASKVLGMSVTGVSFGGTAAEPVPGEMHSENIRTQLYYRAALLVSAGLTDVPDDPALREELLAHSTKTRYKVVKETNPYGQDTRERRPSLQLIEKDKVKDLIGRSPDRADAWVLAVNGHPAPTKREIWAM